MKLTHTAGAVAIFGAYLSISIEEITAYAGLALLIIAGIMYVYSFSVNKAKKKASEAEEKAANATYEKEELEKELLKKQIAKLDEE